MKRLKIFDVAVIGGGPAGISASIQLKRYGLNPILIEKDELGGSLLNANLIENYLGFPKGIGGRDLVNLIRKQLQLHNIKTIFSEAKTIARKKDWFEIVLTNKKIYALAVIVAVGLIAKRLGLQNEDKLYNSKRLFYEIPNIKGKKFIIIGSGDAAFDYALNLAEKTNKVNIICRNSPKCLAVLKQRVKSKGIIVFTNTKVIRFKYNKDMISLICDNGKLIKGDYVIVAVGKKPANDLFKANIKGSLSKYESKGLFIAGDLNKGPFRQLGIAVGDGLIAAMKVKNYLGEKNRINK